MWDAEKNMVVVVKVFSISFLPEVKIVGVGVSRIALGFSSSKLCFVDVLCNVACDFFMVALGGIMLVIFLGTGIGALADMNVNALLFATVALESPVSTPLEVFRLWAASDCHPLARFGCA